MEQDKWPDMEMDTLWGLLWERGGAEEGPRLFEQRTTVPSASGLRGLPGLVAVE